jgi:hypothetical protein
MCSCTDTKGGAMFSRRGLSGDELGQGTVEAAFVLPVLMGLILLLLQPGIVLYDRMVMKAAAAEGCRLLATSSSDFGDESKSVEAFVRHRLASVPPVNIFHSHDDGCTWEIACSGDEDAGSVSVSIGNQLEPVPLVAFGMRAFGALNDSGRMRIDVTESMQTQPSWAWSTSAGQDISAWPGAWLP